MQIQPQRHDIASDMSRLSLKLLDVPLEEARLLEEFLKGCAELRGMHPGGELAWTWRHHPDPERPANDPGLGAGTIVLECAAKPARQPQAETVATGVETAEGIRLPSDRFLVLLTADQFLVLAEQFAMRDKQGAQLPIEVEDEPDPTFEDPPEPQGPDDEGWDNVPMEYEADEEPDDDAPSLDAALLEEGPDDRRAADRNSIEPTED